MSTKSGADGRDTILNEIAKQREESARAGRFFTAFTDDTLRDQAPSNGPIIAWQSWLPAAPAGETLSYAAGIANTTPHRQTGLFAYVFTGPPRIRSIGSAVPVDLSPHADLAPFSGATLPSFPGLSLEPGATQIVSFSIPIPLPAAAGSYPGNCFLLQSHWHSGNTHCDYSFFVFGVR